MALSLPLAQGEEYYKKWKELVYMKFPVEAAERIRREEQEADDPRQKISVVEDQFGYIHKETIRRFTMTNYNQMSVQVITYGAAVTTMCVPDQYGNVDDIVLGFDGIHGYLMKSNPHLGAVVGRMTNKIRNGQITVGGQTFQLSKNYQGHHINGGFRGFDKAIWDSHVHGSKVIFSHVSRDGEEGYPGEVAVQVCYELTPKNALIVEMTATTTKLTPVNMSHHLYFNLAGHSNISQFTLYDHALMIHANSVLVTDKNNIPTGKMNYVQDTPLDFRASSMIFDAVSKLSRTSQKRCGLDHTFVVDSYYSPKTHVAHVYHHRTGRYLEIQTNQPCIHFTTADHFPTSRHRDQLLGKGRVRYSQHNAFCFLTQQYPDGYYDEESCRTSLLKPGEVYRNRVVYNFALP